MPAAERLRPNFNQVQPSDPPMCTSSTQINCIDPESGLYVIGSVSARIAPSSVQSSWFSSSGETYIGSLQRFSTTLGQCVIDNAAQLTAYAFSMARYLQSNWPTFTSATDDIKTFVGVFLAGGATAFELVGAVLAVLSASDWLILLTAIGVTAFMVATIFRCYAVANATG
jgi:hypothetical protein